MKTIGIIGGMSWVSTRHYYEIMNRYVHARLGKHHSIESILYSLNFEKILELVEQDAWDKIGEILSILAKKLETAGADFILVTSNAAHKVFPDIEKATHIPILHIADPTAIAIKHLGIKKVGLLGTKITMEEDFYKKRIGDRYNIEVLAPEKEEREHIHKIIFEELTCGHVHENSQKTVLTMVKNLSNKGAEGIILGCTELTLLMGPQSLQIPLFDTTDLHAKAAVDFAL